MEQIHTKKAKLLIHNTIVKSTLLCGTETMMQKQQYKTVRN
jgi:hypothetical protein